MSRRTDIFILASRMLTILANGSTDNHYWASSQLCLLLSENIFESKVVRDFIERYSNIAVDLDELEITILYMIDDIDRHGDDGSIIHDEGAVWLNWLMFVLLFREGCVIRASAYFNHYFINTYTDLLGIGTVANSVLDLAWDKY